MALACGALGYATFIAVQYARQLPLDLYAARQTQTALTAYWMVKDGFKLAYETPVGGPPWSIPFELPIYQFVVALLSKTTHADLNAVGRLVSFAFLVLTLLPVRGLVKELELKASTFYVFIALLFTSPLYLYWGRAFMIETAAVFFGVMAVYFFVRMHTRARTWPDVALFSFCIALCLMQKVTTGLPIALVLGLVHIGLSVRRAPSLRSGLSTKDFWVGVAAFAMPLMMVILWTHYTDAVKSESLLGIRLTSERLHRWNWGTLANRVSPKLYFLVIWHRIFLANAAGIVGLGLIVAALASRAPSKLKLIVGTSTSLALLPPFLFPNLHIVHTYYQSANVIFLIAALSVAAVGLFTWSSKWEYASVALTLVIATNGLWRFTHDFLPIVRRVYDRENRNLDLSLALREVVPEGRELVVLGLDWTSEISYFSERRSFTAPAFFAPPLMRELLERAETLVDHGTLGAVLLCPNQSTPTVADLQTWVAARKGWSLAALDGCYVASEGVEAHAQNSRGLP